ncbi:hypothetical protein UG55_103198 [Frankia sp. EI5c]|uniref:DUF501 domain-containing protein n=1 Tax=Frankia sp. EI5c TaxID=683316 RepID=UPI0007C2DED9|nr:DUF501 domain-containing protein [Frankia sp. EI5c]OAA24250.1 hypothetical protein UG55_103198 [Frankia sp. EI5c]
MSRPPLPPTAPSTGGGVDGRPGVDRVAGTDQGHGLGLGPETEVVRRQLGREPRAVLGVAHRCSCGLPDVVETAPRLADGTPFPTLFYLTCPRAAAAISRLEGAGVMREMTARLSTDPELARAYMEAHRDYLARRDAHGVLTGHPSAGGMPDRVKCLHVLVAHSLATGPGTNPFGDEALAALGDWGARGPCVEVGGASCAEEPGTSRGRAAGAGLGREETAG